MKKLIFILFVLTLFTACKPASSAAIITSKEAAVKKGIYSEPVTVKSNTVKKTSNKTIAVKEKNPVHVQKSKPKINEGNDNDIIIENENASYLIEQLINSASDNLGTRYRSGGTTRDGFDCSGLMFSTFKKFDITLPRSSHEMAEIGTRIRLENAKKGDLIFFINRGQRRINHVGMVVTVEGDEVKFIHSSTQSGVIISSINEPYYKKTFVQVNRVVQ